MDSADARRRYRGPAYSPPYASIVVDAKTGKVMQGTNPDALRHPASVTKVMTLYMLFEQLERGRFSLESEFRMTSRCAAMAPSKLGLRAGETIAVEDAIKAVVTKSANDVACAIGENIAGSEDAFGDMMTQRARSIGMRSSNFENASGLPNPRQVTTARDLATLGRVIQERFPRYYGYFGTRVFSYDGYAYRNHNRLLGRVEGVDGIKTGYTRASGFNLLTSAKSDGRHIITVVLGGRSGRARDAQVAALVDAYLPRAYAGARLTRPVDVASNEDDGGNVVRPKAQVAAQPLAIAALPPQRPRVAVVTETPPQRPVAQVQAPNPRVGQPMALVAKGTTPVRPGSAPLALAATTTPASPAMRWNVGAQPSPKQQARMVPPGNVTYTNGIDTKAAEAELEQPLPVYNGFGASVKQAQMEKAARVSPASEAVKSRSGWIIQIGATDDEGKARSILAKAKSANPKMLASADAFTEKVQKGDATLYRARFGGFADNSAQAACSALKRSGFACIAQRI
jgi:D-alanyl-D-alanine carboxypeptidase